ncbi:hypothetical protein ACWCXH_17575 [Kitasatospora sp. NPDC001660]
MPTGDRARNNAKHWAECADVYDFLEQVRLRPGMWLPGGSLRHLEAMLIGYRVALGVHSVDEPFDFWPEDSFKAWLWQHLGRHSALGWAAEIERETPKTSTPVAEFFRLLDAFRAEQDHSAARPVAGGSPAAEHPGMQAVRIEIDRHDWNAIHCGCGHSATHLPTALLRLITARTQGEATLADLDNHVMIQSNLMDPAPAATAVVLAALADPTITTPVARMALLELLLYFSAGDTAQQEACEALIRGGIWILYRELTTHPSNIARAHAYETLSNLDTEQDRLAAFHRTIRNHLPADLR